MLLLLKLKKGEEILFVSSKSNFAPQKPIRGGIPVCWPQFGAGKLKQHGFARDSNEWKVVDSGMQNDKTGNSCWITLNLESSEQTLQLWPHHFSLKLTIKIKYDYIHGSQLIQEMEVCNLNPNDPLEFTTALHTYYSVSSIHTASVSNLQDIGYFDKVTQTSHVQSSPFYQFTGETDKIFYKAPNHLIIETPDKSLDLFKSNFPDAVIWNIWEEKIKSSADMAPHEWKEYLCVESGAIGSPVLLQPNQTWKANHTIGSWKKKKIR